MASNRLFPALNSGVGLAFVANIPEMFHPLKEFEGLQGPTANQTFNVHSLEHQNLSTSPKHGRHVCVRSSYPFDFVFVQNINQYIKILDVFIVVFSVKVHFLEWHILYDKANAFNMAHHEKQHVLTKNTVENLT